MSVRWSKFAVAVLALTALVPAGRAQPIRGGPIYGGPIYGGGPSQPAFGPQLSSAYFGTALGAYPQYNGYAISQPYVVGTPGFIAPGGMMMVFPPPPPRGPTPPGPGPGPTGLSEGSRSALNGNSNQPPPRPVQPAIGRAFFTIDVPADAKVWVDGMETRTTGTNRRYLTPANLDPLRAYEYVFRAQWRANGETVTRDKTVRFRAGDDLPVDFTQAAAR
jgi:uncharacterized protein (TIGR03000 family)